MKQTERYTSGRPFVIATYCGLPLLSTPWAKTIKKNTNSTQNKSETHHAKQYEVTSFLSTDCELSTETCSKNVYSLGPLSTKLSPLTSCQSTLLPHRFPSFQFLSHTTSILATRQAVIVTGIRKLWQADKSLFTCLTRQYVCYPSWRCTVNGTLWDACSTSKMTI